jgi:alkylation response protein AidB-like acyl-CoA dehydrogenase
MAIDLRLDDHQLMLEQSMRDFLRQRCPLTVVRQLEDSGLGYSEEMWREMGQLGWLGISIPEEYGGAGRGLLDLYPMYEQFGYSLAPTPHLDTIVIGGGVLQEAGTEDQKRRFLGAMAQGEHTVSLALMEPQGGFGPDGIVARADRDGAGWVLHGTKLLVANADTADSFLWVGRTGGDRGGEGISAFLVAPGTAGLTYEPLTTFSGHRLYAVTFEGVQVPDEDLIGPEGLAWSTIEPVTTRAAVLQTATIVGAARAVLEITNQYAKDRWQFGSPIGRFQAVQYMVTNVLIDLHRADLLTRQAMFRIGTGRSFEREAAIAIAFGKRASANLHRNAHEVHAGVAFMLEHDLTLYSRRAKYWENNLGDARYYEKRLATLTGIT